MTVTVRELIACPPLAAGQLVGGAAGLDRVVASVGVCDTATSVELASPDSLLVLSPRTFQVGTLDAELALRKARGRGVAAIVAAGGEGTAPVSTIRLADKLGLPLIGVALDDAGTTAHRLSELVHQPRLALADAVSATVSTIWAAGSSTEAILLAVGRVLGGRCSVVGVDGATIAGDDLGVELAEHLGGGSLRRRELDGATYSMMPVPLEAPLANTLWLVAEDRLGNGARRLTKPVFEVAVWALAARFANERLVQERDARSRSGVLQELQQAAEPVSQWVVAQAALMGWQLDGWHAAAHLAGVRPEPPELYLGLTEELEGELRRQGLSGVVVPRADGWAFWHTAGEEPGAAFRRELVAALTRTLRSMGALHPGLAICAGVGRAHEGVAGIGRSLAEARQAVLLALAAGKGGDVEHIDEFGVKPLLVGWCSSSAFRELAHALLAPAIDVEGGEELLRTLECYLDHESSVKTTAALLDVHRNTVAGRLDRLRGLLPLDLRQPDERLVLQLACRALRLQRADR